MECPQSNFSSVPAQQSFISTHTAKGPRDGWRCDLLMLAVCLRGKNCAAGDLEGGNTIHVWAYVQTSSRSIWVLLMYAGGSRWILWMCTAECYMDVTSSCGCPILPGINHGNRRQTHPAQVIHGAAGVTFHAGTVLISPASCVHLLFWRADTSSYFVFLFHLNVSFL